MVSASSAVGSESALSVFSTCQEEEYAIVSKGADRVRIGKGSRVWRWKVALPGIESVTDSDPVVSDMRARQYRSAFRGLWEIPAEWMNPYVAEQRLDQNKSLGAAIARRSGLNTPDTLITDSPSIFRDYITASPEPYFAVKAAAAWAALLEGKEAFGAYTVRLDRRSAMELSESVGPAPVVLQPYIQKKFEVRVTCVGPKLFACRIDSQSSDATMVDWRLYPENPVRHSEWPLPSQLEGRILAFMARCGLQYGTIDLIVTPEDDIVFLEVNPAGQYLWIEFLTGLPITSAIADWLCKVPA